MMIDPSFEANRQRLADDIRQTCSDYGLYGNVIYHAPSPFTLSDKCNRNRFYIIAGTDPAFGQDPPPAWLAPDEIIRRNSRNSKLFYTDAWVLNLSSDISRIDVQDQLVEYAKRTEFLSRLYHAQGLSLPVKLRLSEINQLISLYENHAGASDYPALQKKYQAALRSFFRKEKRRNPIYRQWMAYYRSEKYPDGKGPLTKLYGFLRRKNPEISMRQLFDTNDDLKKLELQEYEYSYFRKFMADCYPEISFAVGDREVVNHGLTPKALADKLPVRNVTLEEYNSIRKERFSKEGYAALANMNPSYWEFRDIYYRTSDEPIIASVYNTMRLQYADSNALEELTRFGDLAICDIPDSCFMNFVSLAKSNGLRFYIDTKGDYAVPSFRTIHVLYNTCQEDKMSGIINRLIQDKVSLSHASDMCPTLQNQIDHSRQQSQATSVPTSEQKRLHERD